MAIVGSSWDLPNYIGPLYSASPTQTPILSLVGARSTLFAQNDQFPLSVEYSLPAAGQNVVSENASVTAPTAVSVTRSQTNNCIQIMQHQVTDTYKKRSNNNKLTGIADLNGKVMVKDELAWQVLQKLKIIAHDQEYTWINGTYVAPAAETTVQSSRGVFEAISDASNGIDADGADLSRALINQMLREAFADGALFGDIIFCVNAFQKQQLGSIYEILPSDRTVGGGNLQRIETDVCSVDLVLNPHMDTNDLLMLDLATCSNVFQPVPGKGAIFSEALAKVGAADPTQVYTQFGVDYGPAWAHDAITDLSTS